MPGIGIEISTSSGLPESSSSTGFGNFQPTDISGLMLWLRADAGITLVSGNVSAWADQSGKAHDASNGTAGERPAFNANGFGGKNTPYLLYDGSDDNLAVADHADFEFGAGSFAIFAAMRFVSGTGAFKAPVAKGSDTAGSGWRCFRHTSNALILFPNGGTNYVASGLTLTDGTDAAVMWGYDGVDLKVLYGKGSSRERTSQSNVSIPDTANAVKVGRDNTPSYAANMRLAELLVYKRATTITDSEVATALAYLQNKHGI